MDRERYEQQAQRRRQMGPPRSSDGERRNTEQAESAEPQGGDNDQRTLPRDPERSRRTGSDLQELLIELERERLGCDTIENAFFPAPQTLRWGTVVEYMGVAAFASLLPALLTKSWARLVLRCQEHSDEAGGEQRKTPIFRLAAFKQLEEMDLRQRFYSQPRPIISLYE